MQLTEGCYCRTCSNALVVVAIGVLHQASTTILGIMRCLQIRAPGCGTNRQAKRALGVRAIGKEERRKAKPQAYQEVPCYLELDGTDIFESWLLFLILGALIGCVAMFESRTGKRQETTEPHSDVSRNRR